MRKNRRQATFTPEQRVSLGKAIYAEYAKGIYSLESICKSKKVAIRSLYDWTDKYAELATAKKNATDLLSAPDPDALKVKARVSLEKLITGFDYEEKTVDVETSPSGAIKAQKIRRVTKHVAPDTTAVIFTLKNTDAENFNKGVNDTNLFTEITVESLQQEISPEALELAIKARDERMQALRKKGGKDGR